MPDARFPVLLPTACKVDASNITAGTLPDARFPATLPAVSGANLTVLDASALSVGTIPDARFPSTLPSTVGIDASTNLTAGTIPDARFPATLPEVSGANLTALNATALNFGTIPDARFPSTLPSTVGIDASTNLTAGTIPDARFPATLPAISGANLTNIGIGIITGLGTGVAAFLAAPTSANFRTMVTDESGTGALLFAGSAIGTPLSGTLTNCTGLPVATGISGLASGVAAFLATPSSANFRTMITDESGTGALLFAGGALGTPASGTLKNCTIPNLTGHITSVGNATSLGSFTLAQLSTAVSDAAIARIDAAQTFTGAQTINGDLVLNGANHAIDATGDVVITSNNAVLNCAGAVNFVSLAINAVLSGTCVMVSPSFAFSGTTSTAVISMDDAGGTVAVTALSFTLNGAAVVDVTSTQTISAKTFETCTFTRKQNSQSGNYTLTMGDADTDVLHPAGSGAGDVFTIPANASVAFAIGTHIRFINRDTTNAVSIAINTDTLTLSPGGTTGTRTLAAYGIATAIKITSTEWMIYGTGLT